MHDLDRQQLEQYEQETLLSEHTLVGLTEAETGPERYAKTPLAQLKRLAVRDRDAAEALRLRYRAMSDSALRNRARSGDETARAIDRQRVPSNAADLKKALGSDYRPPHSATAEARDASGRTLWRGQLTSGGMTAAEFALGFPASVLATHTEARAVARTRFAPGVTLRITGQYNPCGSCQRRMQGAVNRHGGTIVYWWPGGEQTFSPR